MTELVRFYFDPLCPWCYQTSRWARRLEELGEIELDWGLFSLELANEGSGESVVKGHARSAPSLRTAVVLTEALGSKAAGAFYATLGQRVHELGEAIDDEATVTGALQDAGIDPAYLAQALDDDSSWARMRAQHEALVEQTRSFGVPTIVLETADGHGAAIFGPVISEVPSDEDAVALFRHVAWLARYDNFSELKRDRATVPDLATTRRASGEDD